MGSEWGEKMKAEIYVSGDGNKGERELLAFGEVLPLECR